MSERQMVGIHKEFIKVKKTFAVLMLATPAWAGPSGQEIATVGNGAGAAPCASCHGAEGQGQAVFPAIAGLDAEYIRRQVVDIRDGKRAAAIMAPSVASLTDDQALAVSNWFAQQAPPPAHPPPTAAQLRVAEPLIRTGDWPGRDLPACAACHGERLQGAGATVPALANQTPEYLTAQLTAFREGTRTDPSGLMTSIGRRLTADEVTALAATIAAFRRPE